MEKIGLIPMTRELCREFYREFENDPMVFMDNAVADKKYLYHNLYIPS